MEKLDRDQIETLLELADLHKSLDDLMKRADRGGLTTPEFNAIKEQIFTPNVSEEWVEALKTWRRSIIKSDWRKCVVERLNQKGWYWSGCRGHKFLDRMVEADGSLFRRVEVKIPIEGDSYKRDDRTDAVFYVPERVLCPVGVEFDGVKYIKEWKSSRLIIEKMEFPLDEKLWTREDWEDPWTLRMDILGILYYQEYTPKFNDKFYTVIDKEFIAGEVKDGKITLDYDLEDDQLRDWKGPFIRIDDMWIP